MRTRIFQKSNYSEVIERNVKRPAVVEKVRYKLRECFAVLASGLGYQNAAEFCQISQKNIQRSSTFYEYQKKLLPILRKLAEQICSEKLANAISEEQLVAAFDAGWAHRRDANQCIGVLMDLLTGYIIAFHMAHHSNEEDDTLTTTSKHAKCMEKICFRKYPKKN